MAANGCEWLRIAADCCGLLRMAANGCGLLRIAAGCCGLLRIAVDCCGLLRASMLWACIPTGCARPPESAWRRADAAVYSARQARMLRARSMSCQAAP